MGVNANLKQGILIGTLLLAIAFLRRPEPFFAPSFYAEDGPIFFAQADGLGEQILLFPYNGYLHTFQRLVAYGASFAPLEWLPSLYLAGSLLPLLLIVVLLNSRRCPLVGPGVLAAAAALVPMTGEVFFNLTNTQWLNGLALCLVLVSKDPERAREWGFDCLVVLLIGLSGVFAVVFAPLFLLRAWMRRTGASFLIAGVIVAAAATQVLHVMRSDVPHTPFNLAWWDYFHVFGRRVVLGTVIGPAADGVPMPVATGVGIGALAAIGAFLGRTSPAHPAWYLVAIGPLVVAGAVLRYRYDPGALNLFENADRYFYIPRVLLAWVLLSWLGQRFKHGTWQLATLAFLAAVSATSPLQPFVLYSWSDDVERLRKGGEQTIITNPYRFSFKHRLNP